MIGEQSRVAGLVLAAGAGRRLGRPKALLEIGGERLVDRAVRILRQGGVETVVVVSGAAPLDGVDATVVNNPQWDSGMGSSLRVGLGALPTEVDAVVVALVDTPRIGPEAVHRVIGSGHGRAALAVATYDGRRGHPGCCWAGITGRVSLSSRRATRGPAPTCGSTPSRCWRSSATGPATPLTSIRPRSPGRCSIWP